MASEPVKILIKRARQRKRLTQEQLAAQLGVTTATVSNWETGAHFPVRYAGAIEEALDITIPAQEDQPEAASA